MKELSIEEKAKAYDVAIKKAKSKIKDDKDHVLYEDDIIDLFPELAKSEDEGIRKALLDMVHNTTGGSLLVDYNLDKEDAIAWLEKQGKHKHQYNSRPRYVREEELLGANKQGEQKPADKIEQKFKIGDWVVNNNGEPQFSQVTSRSWPDSKIKRAEDNLELFINTATLDKQYHLWTIKDAKDGDVLSYPDGSITLFKYMNENIYIAHILWVDGHIELNNSCAISNVHPATKEQRDLLFQKMKEAGYEWDADKKELKKIEQKPIIVRFKVDDVIKDISCGETYTITRYIKNGIAFVDNKGEEFTKYYDEDDWDSYELVEQKPIEWSDEDEKMLKSIVSDYDDMVNESEGFAPECNKRNWLKSLRPQKQILYDAVRLVFEENLTPYKDGNQWCFLLGGDIQSGICGFGNTILDAAVEFYKEYDSYKGKIDEIQRPQKQWKPSDEQINALRVAIGDEQSSDCCDILRSLLKDLKSL